MTVGFFESESWEGWEGSRDVHKIGGRSGDTYTTDINDTARSEFHSCQRSPLRAISTSSSVGSKRRHNR